MRVGADVKRVGTLMKATALDRVTPAMQIYAEESFGPVVSVVRVMGQEEALRIADDREYGLSAAIFSRDFARAWRLAMRVESGICPSTDRRCTTNLKCRLVE